MKRMYLIIVSLFILATYTTISALPVCESTTNFSFNPDSIPGLDTTDGGGIHNPGGGH
jgi:hypothetical protein